MLLRIKIHVTFNVSFIDLIEVARLKDLWKTRGRGPLEQFGTAEQILESLFYFRPNKIYMSFYALCQTYNPKSVPNFTSCAVMFSPITNTKAILDKTLWPDIKMQPIRMWVLTCTPRRKIRPVRLPDNKKVAYYF